MFWEATWSINKSVNGKSALWNLFANHPQQSQKLDLNILILEWLLNTISCVFERARMWQNLSCWDLLHSCWLTGVLDVYLSTTLKLRPEFDFYMKLIYHTERATAELGYGRGMNAWAMATKGFYFHTFTQSLSLSIGLIIAMSLSTASKENILLKLALNSFKP